MSGLTIFHAPLRYRVFSVGILCLAAGGYFIATNGPGDDVSARSPRQNLIQFDATDVCEMLPMKQFGNPLDEDGRTVEPVMTVYLRSPEGRRPKTGDVLEIKHPKELEGHVRFKQITNDGYGGSGPLEWVGTKREAELAMAVWDMTESGSLQYRKGETLLWGDCKKSHELPL